MKKFFVSILTVFCLLICVSGSVNAQEKDSIVIATGQEVPDDSDIKEEYRFPEEYRDYAVQFVTEDGVALCGYVLGEGNKGVAIAHAKGWMLKSCLPFGERLADEGYQVILWEFRNTYPSGNADEKSEELWNLDVLAAVQVLRERGVDEVFCMGASYGGSATAVAAVEIPELVGVAILSSPANVSDIDPIGAMRRITVPAFFAVSIEDFQGAPGVYQKEVETLYEACASTQKEIHILEGTAHGTDLITVPPEGGLGYASIPKTDEAVQERNEMADLLLQFIGNTFTASPESQTDIGVDFTKDMADNDTAGTISTKPADGEYLSDGIYSASTESETSGKNNSLAIFDQCSMGHMTMLVLLIVFVIGVLVILIRFKRK